MSTTTRLIAALLVAGLFVSCSSDDSSDPAGSSSEVTTTTTTVEDTIAETTDTTSPDPVDPRSEFEQRSVTVGELEFDLLAAGPVDGEPVILLHGFPQGAWEWRHQLRFLSDAGYRVIAPDQRGYSAGARPPDVEDYAITLLSQDVLGIADQLGFERFHLVGHDWGAGVAWTTALLAPDRLYSVTSVSVPHPAAYAEALEDPDGDQSSKVAYIGLFTGEGAVDMFLADDAAFLRGIVTDAGGTEEDAQVYVDLLGTPEAIDAALNWYRATDLLSGVAPPAVEIPTLFVWSDGDCCLGRDSAELTENYVTGPYEFVVLEGVSHWVPEEAPDALNDELLEHFQANAAEDATSAEDL